MLTNSSLKRQSKYIFHKNLRNSKNNTNENNDNQINYLSNNNIIHQENLEKSEIIEIPNVIMPKTHDNFYNNNENLNDTTFSSVQKNLKKKKICSVKKINSEQNFSKINPYIKQNIENNNSHKIFKNDFFINGNNNDITLIAPEILYNFDSPNNNTKKINLYQNYNKNLINKIDKLKIQQSNKSNINHKKVFSLDNIENISYNRIKNRSNNNKINSSKNSKIEYKKKIENYKCRNNNSEVVNKLNISQKLNNDYFNENLNKKDDKILNNKIKSIKQLRSISQSYRYQNNVNKTNSYINYITDISLYDPNADNSIHEPRISAQNYTQNIILNDTNDLNQNNSRNNENNKKKIINNYNNINKLRNYPSFSNLCVNKEKLLNKIKLYSFNNNYDNLNIPANHILNYSTKENLIYDKQKSLLNESINENYDNKFEKTFNNFHPNLKIEINQHDNVLNNPIYQNNNDSNVIFTNNINQLSKSYSMNRIINSNINLKQHNINNLNQVYKKPEKLKKNKQFSNRKNFTHKEFFAIDSIKDINNNHDNYENKKIIEIENNNFNTNNKNFINPINKSLDKFRQKVFGNVNNINKHEEKSNNNNNIKEKKVNQDKKIETITERNGDEESEIIEDDTTILNNSCVHGDTINMSNRFSNRKNTNRFFKKYNSLSQAGKEFNNNSPKINQDLPIIYISINGIIGFNLFGVLDGHGVNGHHVSKFLGEFITNELSNIKEISKIKDLKLIYEKFKQNDYEIIKNLFLNADKCLLKKNNINCELSGSTCVIVIQIGKHLLSANVGDSRAILIYEENKIFELSHDFKPDIPQEKERIYKMGGIVDRLEDFNGIKVGPLRVWSKNKNFPGLAMSRSIGDFIGKQCGIISVPEIIEYDLNEKSKYMVICSDGVWEFLSNEDVMIMGNQFYLQNDIIGFTNKLIDTATTWWKKEDVIIDDITAVIIFF